MEALQAKFATRVAKLDKELINDEVLADDEVLTDDEEHEEVFTLGRMGTRSQTRVNQYFTNMEIEEENRIDSDGDDGEDDEGSEAGFDPSDDGNDFNQEIDGDLNMADENMV